MAEPSSLERLPLEVMLLIMAQLPFKTGDLLNLALTSKMVHTMFIDKMLPLRVLEIQYGPYVLLAHPRAVAMQVNGALPVQPTWADVKAISDHYERDGAPLLQRHAHRDLAMIGAALQDTIAISYAGLRNCQHPSVARPAIQLRLQRLNMATLLRLVLQPEAVLILRWVADAMHVHRWSRFMDIGTELRNRALAYVAEVRTHASDIFTEHAPPRTINVTVNPATLVDDDKAALLAWQGYVSHPPIPPNPDVQLAFILDQHVQGFGDFRTDVSALMARETSRLITHGEARLATERRTTEFVMLHIHSMLTDRFRSAEFLRRIELKNLSAKIRSALLQNNSLEAGQIRGRMSYEATQLGMRWDGMREQWYNEVECLPRRISWEESHSLLAPCSCGNMLWMDAGVYQEKCTHWRCATTQAPP